MKGTNIIMFINREYTPKPLWQYVSYGRVVVSYGTEKKDPKTTRVIVGGHRIPYPRYCGTLIVYLPTVKLLLNSVISAPGARYMTIYIKNFYLNTPMKRNEYMRMKLSDLPKDFIKKYKLAAKTTKDGYIYIKICKGIYGIKQAGILEQKMLW